jgi:signal peptidase I
MRLDLHVLKREASLAIGLVILLLGSMTIATGSYPPMVVVESGSMMHDNEHGSVGAIDPGDLVLVMSPDRHDIITFAEATETGGEHEGYETHGMPGDVIIFRKNGGSDTPVIHRALLQAIANPNGGWDVPGTDVVGAESGFVELEYDCFHGNSKLKIDLSIITHEGYITTGDNRWSNGCQYDQQSLTDENGELVTAIKDEWIMGVASLEIPWVGAVKLYASGTAGQVTGNTWGNLAVLVAIIISAPVIIEMITDRLTSKNEDDESNDFEATEASSEEE